MMYENFLGNKTAWKVIRVLSEAPGKNVSRSEIRKISGSGNFALSDALEKLVCYKILFKKKVGKKEYFWMNSSDGIVKELLRLFELERIGLKAIQPSKIIFLARIIDRIISDLKPKGIMLFGSYAKGIAGEDSDFDLCVIVEKKTIENKLSSVKLPENVQIHLFEEKEFDHLKDKKDKLVEEILKDGIKII